jgi:L-2-hydroxyglutarate oxidase LhgO
VNDVESVISKLEKQRSAIDRAISALREITGSPTTGPDVVESKTKKRRLSPEGRKRIIEATKRRWAAKRTAQTAAVPARSRRGKLSDAGRKRLALAMKKRWASAKNAGKQRLA